MPRAIKSQKRYCSYCNKDRSVKNFGRDPQDEICNFCYDFDRAAQITAPKILVTQ